MNAHEIMTPEVHIVGPDVSVAEIARTLLKRHISGVPVIEDDKIIGIVSEGDLIHRQEIGTEKRPGSWWLRLCSGERSPIDFIKSHGVTARDVMTHPVITITEDTPLDEIADLFEKNGIKRVPVERDGKLVGIVSRANLLQALTAAPPLAKHHAGNDEGIRTELLRTLNAEPWWNNNASHLVVSDGVVHIWGFGGTADIRDATRIAALNVAGVRDIEDHRLENNILLQAE